MIAKHPRMFGRPIGQFEDRKIDRQFNIVKRDTNNDTVGACALAGHLGSVPLRRKVCDAAASSTAHVYPG